MLCCNGEYPRRGRTATRRRLGAVGQSQYGHGSNPEQPPQVGRSPRESLVFVSRARLAMRLGSGNLLLTG